MDSNNPYYENNLKEKYSCNASFSFRSLASLRSSADLLGIITTTIDSLASKMETENVEPPYYIYCSPVIINMILSRLYPFDNNIGSHYFGISGYEVSIFGYEVISDYSCHDPEHFEERMIMTNVRDRVVLTTNKKDIFPVIYKFYQ